MDDMWLLISGALLAIMGGGLSDEFRAWRERGRELKSINISIGDELGEIVTTISNMGVVWTEAKMLSPAFVANLLANTTAFDNLRTRLFLIKDKKLRKKIVTFYKDLKDKSKESEGKIGTLDVTPEATAEQAGFNTEFQALGTRAKAIQKELEG